MTIKMKALSLFSAVKENDVQEVTGENFNASNGWFERYKTRSKIHNVRITGEAASADKDAAVKYPNILKKIIDEGGYSDQQIFNVDETGLFWKRMPSKTFLARKEKSMSGFKVAKDRLTLLLGGNAEGDLKLKPMLIYRSQNPRALKGCDQRTLPVFWRANKKAWVRKAVFEDWFMTYFCPTVKKYCKENNLSFKILLILDNAPGHPASLGDLCENVKVIFLPPNTTSLIQPMDQGTIATFKAYYLRRTFKQAITETTGDDTISLTEFWKKYNIKQAIQNIDESWQEVTVSNMRAVWKHIIPHCANDFGGFAEHCANDFVGFAEQVTTVVEEITDIGRQLGFDEIDNENVHELIESHAEDLSDNDLINMEQQRAYEQNDEEECIETQPAKELTLNDLDEMFRLMENFKQRMMDSDPDIDRSMQVRRNLENDIKCYRKLYEEKKKAKNEKYVQTSLLKFFSKQ